jgi:hypothetical protein
MTSPQKRKGHAAELAVVKWLRAKRASMLTVSKQVHTLIEAMYLAGLAL